MFKKILLAFSFLISSYSLALPMVYDLEFSGYWYPFDFHSVGDDGTLMDYKVSIIADTDKLEYPTDYDRNEGMSSSTSLWVQSYSIVNLDDDTVEDIFYSNDVDINNDEANGSVSFHDQGGSYNLRVVTINIGSFFAQSFEYLDSDGSNEIPEMRVGDVSSMELFHQYYNENSGELEDGSGGAASYLTSITPYYYTSTVPEVPTLWILLSCLLLIVLFQGFKNKSRRLDYAF